jgi:hypothetical protein
MALVRILLYGLILVSTHVTLSNIYGLWQNIRTARRSGIPYIIVPISSYNLLFVLFGARVLDILNTLLGLPSSETSWRWLVRGSWPWRHRHAPFEQMGSDTFLTVAPGGSILYTADADVIRQILGRMSDFPKPTFLYKNVDIFGKSVVTTEGPDWRRHRRLVAPAFGEKNNLLVWKETIRQTEALLKVWTRKDTAASPTSITTVHRDSMQLSLNVIGRAGFGRDMGLPTDQCTSVTLQEAGVGSKHTMTFVDSLRCLLKNIMLIVVLPKAALSESFIPSRPLSATANWRR